MKPDAYRLNKYDHNVRVTILVDVQNVFYGARDQFSGKLDFARLMYEALRGRSLVRAVAYCVTCPGTDPGHSMVL